MDKIKMCDVDKIAELVQIHKVEIELWTTNENGESEMKKGMPTAAALALVALGAVSEVQATTTPRAASSLYKSGCEPTEPAPASSVSSASGASAPLDSRAAQSATSV